ncbi:MAG: dihydrodipicolinate synthase family protein [Planctomycetes bacterium]|nr:dihydrodipicolinate synthase family protein [Planctomycetota bacterium]
MKKVKLIAAAFTPMEHTGELCLNAIPALVDFVLKQDIDGLFVCGSTGEFSSLSVQERMDVLAKYQLAIAGRTRTFAHVGSNSIQESRQLAEHAATLDVDAIAYAPPSYFRPADVHAVAECLIQVAAAAPVTPLFYYHIPPLTGVHIRAIDLLPLMAEQVSSFAGVKFSCTQLDDLARCVQYDDRRYEMLFGADEMLLAGLATGAGGAVGSTYNFLTPYYRRMISAYEQGDMELAQRAQSAVSHHVHRILKYGGINAIKATMSIAGLDCGPPRLPLQPLTEAQMQELGDEMRPILQL